MKWLLPLGFAACAPVADPGQVLDTDTDVDTVDDTDTTEDTDPTVDTDQAGDTDETAPPAFDCTVLGTASARFDDLSGRSGCLDVSLTPGETYTSVRRFEFLGAALSEPTGTVRLNLDPTAGDNACTGVEVLTQIGDRSSTYGEQAPFQDLDVRLSRVTTTNRAACDASYSVCTMDLTYIVINHSSDTALQMRICETVSNSGFTDTSVSQISGPTVTR